jgi:hypothetical protein
MKVEIQMKVEGSVEPMPANVRRELLQIRRCCQRMVAERKRLGKSTAGMPELRLIRELDVVLELHPTPPPRKDRH